MRTFVTTRGIKFNFYDSDRERLILTDRAPINADLEEYVDFIREERVSISKGPQLVKPRLIMNGAGLQVEYDSSLATGEILYINEYGTRVVLKEGGTPALAEVPRSREGARQAGATVVADATIPYSGEEAQR